MKGDLAAVFLLKDNYTCDVGQTSRGVTPDRMAIVGSSLRGSTQHIGESESDPKVASEL